MLKPSSPNFSPPILGSNFSETIKVVKTGVHFKCKFYSLKTEVFYQRLIFCEEFSLCIVGKFMRRLYYICSFQAKCYPCASVIYFSFMSLYRIFSRVV